MPAAGVIVEMAVDMAVSSAMEGVIGSIAGSTILADVATGMIVGAAGGAVTAAVTGGNVIKGLEKGAIAGGVSGGVQSALAGKDNLLPKGMTVGKGAAGQALAKGLGTAAGALATGSKPGTALEKGLIAGGMSYAFTPPAGADSTTKTLYGLGQTLASTGVNQLLAKSPTQGFAPSAPGGPTSAPNAPPPPSSGALAQALNVGDAGAPVLGGEKDPNKKNVWNMNSLRYMGNQENS